MSTVYNAFISDVLSGLVSWPDDDFRMMLCTSDYTPAASHDTPSDAAGAELSDASYARQPIGGQSFWFLAEGLRCYLDDTTFPTLAATAAVPAFAVVYRFVDGTDSNDRLVACVTLDTPDTPNGTDYVVNLPTGIAIFTAAP